MKYIYIILLFLWGFSVHAQTQGITVFAGSETSCAGYVDIPIYIQGVDSAAAISLALEFDELVLDFDTLFDLHPVLASGVALSGSVNGQVLFSWYDTVDVALANDTLFKIRFISNGGTSPLSWNIQQLGLCEFADENGDILVSVNYQDGNVFSAGNDVQIVTQPSDQNVFVDDNVSFSVSAQDALTYQWEVSIDSGTTWNNLQTSPQVPNVQSATLNINNAQLSMSGNLYRCVLTGNCFSSDTTQAAELIVDPIPQLIEVYCGTTSTCAGMDSVPVWLEEGDNIAAINLKLAFDENVLSVFDACSFHPVIPVDAQILSNYMNGYFYLSMYCTTEFSIGTDTLFWIKFYTNGGNSYLDWDTQFQGACEFADGNGTIINSVYYNGDVYSDGDVGYFTTQPEDLSVYYMASATISRPGPASFSYQWQIRSDSLSTWGNVISNNYISVDGNNNLQFDDCQFSMSGNQFRCLVWGACPPTDTSNVATLTVDSIPPDPQVINMYLGTLNECPGIIEVPIRTDGFIDVASISLAFDYDPSVLTYLGVDSLPLIFNSNALYNASNGQFLFSWYNYNPKNFVGDTLFIVRFSSIGGNSPLNWDTQTNGLCEFADENGSIIQSTYQNGNASSNGLFISEIIDHPQDSTVIDGESVSFSVSVPGPTPTYSWQQSTDMGMTWGMIGSNSHTLSFSNVDLIDDGNWYRCIVQGTCDPVDTSDVAMLYVNPAPPPPQVIELSLPSVTNSCTGNLSIPLIVNEFTNVGAMSLSILFDTASLDFINISGYNSSFPYSILQANALNGNLFVSWFDTAGATVPSQDTLFYINFISQGGSSNLIWNTQLQGLCEFTDTDGNVIQSTYDNGFVSIDPNPLIVNAGDNDTIATGGSIVLSPTILGGTAPYSYLWQPAIGLSDTTIENPVASPTQQTDYILNVTDTLGCVATDQTTVVYLESPCPIINTHPVSQTKCEGAAVVFSVQASGTSLTYQWQKDGLDIVGAISNVFTISNVILADTGNYVCIVSKPTCSVTSNVASLTINPLPEVNLIGLDSLYCLNADNDTLQATPNFGTFSSNVVNGIFSASDIGIGTHTISYAYTDNNGCTNSASFVTQVVDVPLLSLSGVDALCFGDNTGQIDITVLGGESPFNFLWSNGEESEDLLNIVAGAYSISVTDANSCLVTDTISIGQGNQINPVFVVENVSVNGQADGAIGVSATGGVAPYVYSWSTGATVDSISNLIAGVYFVTITDSLVCSTVASAVVNPPQSISITETDVSCFGFADGLAEVIVSGGYSPFGFVWSNGDTTAIVDNLDVGEYYVTITDGQGSSYVDTAIIDQPTALLITGIVLDVNCYGGSNGEIDITTNGGSSPYTFFWSNGESTEDISGLSAGIYSITVSDANGCVEVESIEVAEPQFPISINSSTVNISCYGYNNGSILTNVAGGTSPYSFNWTGGSTQGVISGLQYGNYTVIVTDANGCTNSETIEITQPNALILTIQNTTVLCNGDSTGSAWVDAQEGTPSYTYQWSGGYNTDSIEYLTAGNYAVTVIDANGCTETAITTVSESATLVLNLNPLDVSCFGNSDGEITSNTTGGTLPYSYSWQNGESNSSLSSLAPGLYTLTVTDANACTVTGEAQITEPTALAFNTIITHATFNGASNGTIDLVPSGGTTPYSFTWSNGESSEDVSGLVAGMYYLTLTDANACSVIDSFEITEPACVPAIAVDPDTIDFGIQTVSANTITDTVWITNTGTCALEIDSLFGLGGVFSLDTTYLTNLQGFQNLEGFIQPGTSIPIPIVLNQNDTAGIYVDTLNISSNASDSINLSDGLVAWYPFNGNANDSIGMNDGLIYGDVLSTDDRFGNSNSAYSFDGNGDWISTPSTIINGAFSMVAWIKTTQQSTNYAANKGVILATTIEHGNSGQGFILTHGGPGVTFSKYPHSVEGWNLGGYPNINNNEWRLLSATWDGTINENGVKLYVDGILLGTTTALNSSISHNFNMRIGYSYEGPYHFYHDGLIDDIRIYDRALSEAEIQALYYEGTGVNSVSQVIVQAELINPCEPIAVVSTQSITETLDFGTGLVDSFMIKNTGCGDLIADISSGASWLEQFQTTLTVPEADSVYVVYELDGNQTPDTLLTQLTITTSDTVISIPVELTVIGAVCEVSPSALDFGSLPTTEIGTQVFYISNTGNDTLAISSISAGPPFSVSYTPAAIPPGAPGLPVTVTFYPDSVTSYTGEVQINSNSIDPCTVILSGQGIQPIHSWSFSPGLLDFGLVELNTTVSLPIMVSNTGNVAINYLADVFSNPEFTISNPAGSLGVGSSQEVWVSFTPTAILTYEDSVEITVNPTANVVQLLGHGYIPSIAPTLVYDTLAPFSGASGVSPAIASLGTYFEYRVVYTDADNNPPMAGYPKLAYSWNDDGNFTTPGDYNATMQEDDPTDIDFTDGKHYTYLTQLNLGGHAYKFLASNSLGNPATGQALVYKADPKVSNDSLDLSIFAGDITFSDNSPAIGDVVDITATIHNHSDYPATDVWILFEVKNDTVDTLFIPYMQPQSSASVTVQHVFGWWDYYPVTVSIDPDGLQSESTILNNSAIRPIMVGNVPLPGSIDITWSGLNNSTVYPGNTLVLSGHAQYSNTSAPVSGAQVQATMSGTGQQFMGNTDGNGNFSIYFSAPYFLGNYTVQAEVTDFTLTATTSQHQFSVVPVPIIGSGGSATAPYVDLRIENSWINLDPGCITTNTPVEVSGFFTNSGTDSTGKFLMAVLVDGSLAMLEWVNNLEAGQSMSFSQSVIFTTDSTHTISVVLDPFHQISESNENNNTATMNINVYEDLPDLAPVDIAFSDNSPFTGQAIDMQFTVGNFACTPSSPVMAIIKDETTNTILSTVSLNAIGGFGQEIITLSNVDFTTSGYHLISIYVYPDSILNELDEGNQYYSEYIFVEAQYGDVKASNILVSPLQIQPGGMANISATVSNIGVLDLHDFFVRFYVDGLEVADSVWVDTLEAGANLLVQSGQFVVADCPQQAMVFADADSSIFEQNEYNNKVYRTLGYDARAVSAYQYNSPYNRIQVLDGSQVNLMATIKNNGAYSLSNVPVSFVTNGLLLGSTTVSYIGPGSSSPVDIWCAFPGLGNYTVNVIADSLLVTSSVYCELNENNNTVPIYLNVFQYEPDLAVESEDIAPSKRTAQVGDSILINVTVDNIGLADADTFPVTLEADNVLVGDTLWVNGLDSIEDVTMGLTDALVATQNGIIILRLTANGDSTVFENDYSNNVATSTIIVGLAPDFTFDTLACITVSDTTALPGQTITISANVWNAGNNSGWGTVNFYIVDAAGNITPISSSGGIPTGLVGANSYVTIEQDWLVDQFYATILVEIVDVGPYPGDSDPFNNSCVYEFGQPYSPLATSLLVSDTVVCPGSSSLLIAQTQFGTSNKRYQWYKDGIALSADTSAELDAYPDTTTLYSVEVWDDSLSITHSVLLGVYETPVLSATIDSISCHGAGDGQIAVSLSGGTGPFGFAWTPSNSGDSIGNLTGGNYHLTVTYADGCAVMESYDVHEPGQLTMGTGLSHVSEFCAGDGQVVIDSISGGTPPYNFAWSNGGTGLLIDSLAPGTYWLSLSDSHGCGLVDSFEVLTNASQTLHLVSGWGLYSTYIDPYNPDIDSVFAPVVDSIEIVKNGYGLIYWPQYYVNGIGAMVLGEGYQVKSNALDTLDLLVEGLYTAPELYSFEIPQGWSIVGYLRISPANIDSLFSDYVNDVVIVKSGDGLIYWPAWYLNQIGNMIPGDGYQIKMSSARTFSYPPNSMSCSKSSKVLVLPQYYPMLAPNASNMTLGLHLDGMDVQVGDEIGVFSKDGLLVGSAVVEGDFVALTLWGDDELTENRDGLKQAEQFDIRLWNSETREERSVSVLEWIEGNGSYEANKVAIATVETLHATSLLHPVLYQNTPNPFADETEISFYLAYECEVELAVYDVNGELVLTLIDESEGKVYDPGRHSIKVDGARLPSGTFYYQLKAIDWESSKKMILIHK